jgi:hypothetical protein
MTKEWDELKEYVESRMGQRMSQREKAPLAWIKLPDGELILIDTITRITPVDHIGVRIGYGETRCTIVMMNSPAERAALMEGLEALLTKRGRITTIEELTQEGT